MGMSPALQVFEQIVRPRPWPFTVTTDLVVFLGRGKVLTHVSWPHSNLADYILAFLNSCPTQPTGFDCLLISPHRLLLLVVEWPLFHPGAHCIVLLK